MARRKPGVFDRTPDDEAGPALKLARAVDPKADYPSLAGENDGCLLIANEHAEAVMALLPGSWDDPNEPPTAWTRIVFPEERDR